MEVLGALPFLVTNAEVLELLREVDKEAKSTGFKRTEIAEEVSQHVFVYAMMICTVLCPRTLITCVCLSLSCTLSASTIRLCAQLLF